jgi:exopolyphosphatase/guanosine-5'-triphosphate,3'-diphosphate pyrophosphatase
MKAAVIDLGTNTFNVLIGEIQQGALRFLHSSRVPVRLGKGGLEQGYITYHAFQRGLLAMQQHAATIREFGVEKVVAYATSAVRSSLNGNDFVKVVFEETGIEIEVIDGNREAELIFKGIRQAYTEKNMFLAMDIGGGSTEFIVGNGDEILWKQSTDLGVSRLMGLFSPQDPFSLNDIQRLERHFKNELKGLEQALLHNPCSVLVGSSGSFETFAAMIANDEGLDFTEERNCLFEFSPHQFLRQYQWLIQSNSDERSRNSSIKPVRKDLIVAGSLLTCFVMNLCSPTRLVMSGYALKEGALHELLIQTN